MIETSAIAATQRRKFPAVFLLIDDGSGASLGSNTHMNNPLVSIILPTRNGERFLDQALDSVFRQEYAPYELLVVDDHSTDRSAEMAKGCAGVRFLPNPGRGVGCAWNAGIAASSGELVAFLAQDDLWLPEKLARQVAFMWEQPSVDYSLTWTHTFLEPGDTPPAGCRTDRLGQDSFFLLMEALMVRRPVFDRIGGFNEELTSGQDMDWFARASDAGLVMAKMREVLVRRRIHCANATFDPKMAREGNQNILRIARASILRKQHRGGAE